LEIKPAVAAATALLLSACSSNTASEPPELVLSHQQLHDPLVTIRGANRVCLSESEQCQQWTVLMLDCEQGTADSCQEAEDLRKQASGVASDSAPEAYAF